MNRRDLAAGALAGAAATVPMTVVMSWLHQQLPRRERYPLEPSLIVQRLERAVGLDARIGVTAHMGVALLAHLGMGMTAGALYPAFARRAPVSPLVGGVLFGLLVWLVNYDGLLPALRILPPDGVRPPRRTGLIVAAHVVWGGALGLLVQRLR